MDDLALSVRSARPEDAADLARIYIESWQDAYAGILPHAVLATMSVKRHTARWSALIRGGAAVLVAQDARHGAIGLASLGAARDSGLGFAGEIYTLYVDPAFTGHGAGRALMAGAFDQLKQRGLGSCAIWAHARNNACFFYEAMGGQRIATRTTRLMGELTPEIAFGWRQLATQKHKRAPTS